MLLSCGIEQICTQQIYDDDPTVCIFSLFFSFDLILSSTFSLGYSMTHVHKKYMG